jgi:hypothetical protein
VQLRRFFLIGVTLLAAACAAQSTTGGVSRNLITAEELARAGDVNLYDAVSRLRPTFLRPRTPANTGVQTPEISVYYDGQLMPEGLNHLREVAAKNVQEVRYLEPQQANARFGVSNSSGALVVTTKK